MVADDTDIFVLLFHFCCQGDIPVSTSVLMVSPIRGRAVIDINATVDLHRDIIPDRLAAHGLTGCDTVATYFGILNAAALKVLTSGVHALTYVGNTSRILSEITAQATPFILACYAQTKCTSLTGARQIMWANKVGQRVAGAQKLAFLPPTNEAFNENVARAHLQVAVWRNTRNHIHRQLIQQLVHGHWKKDPKLLSRQHFPVTPRLHQMIYRNS